MFRRVSHCCWILFQTCRRCSKASSAVVPPLVSEALPDLTALFEGGQAAVSTVVALTSPPDVMLPVT